MKQGTAQIRAARLLEIPGNDERETRPAAMARHIRRAAQVNFPTVR